MRLILSENLAVVVDSKFLQRDGQEKGSTASQKPYDSNEGGFRSSFEDVGLEILGEEVVRDDSNRDLYEGSEEGVPCCGLGCRGRLEQ